MVTADSCVVVDRFGGCGVNVDAGLGGRGVNVDAGLGGRG